MSARRTYYLILPPDLPAHPPLPRYIFYVVAMGRDLPGNNEEQAVRVLAREIQNPLVRYRGHRRGLQLSELYDGIGCQRRSDEQSRKMFPGVAGDEKGPGPVSETRPRDRPRKMR